MKVFALLAIAAALVSPQAAPPTAKAPSPEILVSGASVEALVAEIQVAVAADGILALAPGVRLTHVDSGVSLATHDGAKVEVQVGDETLTLPSPAIARRTEQGWVLGGVNYRGTALSARRRAQDDTDTNLKSMQESARKLRNRSPQDPPSSGKPRALHGFHANAPPRLHHPRFLYTENPMVTSVVFNSVAVKQLLQLSPIGF